MNVNIKCNYTPLAYKKQDRHAMDSASQHNPGRPRLLYQVRERLVLQTELVA